MIVFGMSTRNAERKIAVVTHPSHILCLSLFSRNRFKFTHLDPQDAYRPFSVLLAVNPNSDLYEIHECEPSVISSDRLSELVNILNQEEPVNPMCDNFKTFAQHLRHAFLASLVERTPMRR